MNVHLDMCAIQRPLDTRTNIRISIEAEAVLGIIALCESGMIDLISSDALLYELANNPHPVRKQYAVDVLSKAQKFFGINDEIENRARVFIAMNVKPLDALLRKAKQISDLKTRVISVMDFIQEIQQ